MQLSDFHLVLQIFLGASAAIVVIGGFLRWADGKLEKKIVQEIREATYQIQPNTNGGSSLKDLHKKVDWIIKDVNLLKTSVLRLEDDVRELEEDVVDLR